MGVASTHWRKFFTFGLLLYLPLSACSSAPTPALPQIPSVVLQANCLPATNEAMQAVGKRVYQRVCASCHQADGRGLAEIFPPVAGHAPALAQTEAGRTYLMRLVLWGLSGPITINQKIYNNVMPPQAGLLSDAEVAGVLSYVMQAFDNCRAFTQPPSFTADTVKALRQTTDSGLGTFELRKNTAFAP